MSRKIITSLVAINYKSFYAESKNFSLKQLLSEFKFLPIVFKYWNALLKTITISIFLMFTPFSLWVILDDQISYIISWSTCQSYQVRENSWKLSIIIWNICDFNITNIVYQLSYSSKLAVSICWPCFCAVVYHLS